MLHEAHCAMLAGAPELCTCRAIRDFAAGACTPPSPFSYEGEADSNLINQAAGRGDGMSEAFVCPGYSHTDRPLRRRTGPVRADDLAAHSDQGVLTRHEIDPAAFGEVVLGRANQAGEDNHPLGEALLVMIAIHALERSCGQRALVSMRTGMGPGLQLAIESV
jgi:hypothetical protein